MKKYTSILICLVLLLMLTSTTIASEDDAGINNSSVALFTGSASSHYMLLSSNGDVYAWGKNTYGQCGAELCDEIDEMNSICFENSVVKVSAGNDFSIALDENNVAWGWGNNRRFQLGISRPTGISGAPTYFTEPEKIAENIIDIATGNDFSILLNEDGEVLFSGMSIFHTLKKLNLPEIDGNAPKIRKIFASYNNIVAISESDDVFYGRADSQRMYVVEMPVVDEIQSVVSGKEHLIIRCLNGENIEFYGFGDNSKNQLGQVDVYSATEPILVLSIPHKQGQNITEFAGTYNTIVNVWDNLMPGDMVTEYSWGTYTVVQSENSDASSAEQITIDEPKLNMVDYLTIAVGDENNIGFKFKTNEIMIYNYFETLNLIPIKTAFNPVYKLSVISTTNSRIEVETTNQSGVVILVIYNSDKIVKQVLTKNAEKRVVFDNVDLDGCRISLMQWNGIDMLEPIAEKITIEVSD